MTRLWHVMTMTQVHASLRYLRFGICTCFISAYFCIFLYIFLYISMPDCNNNSRAKSLGHEDLIRWGDLAGHSALELHHAIFVDEFQPSQHPSHCSKVVTHDLHQAARPHRLGILRSKLSTKRILSYNICIISYIDSQGKLQFRKLLWRSSSNMFCCWLESNTLNCKGQRARCPDTVCFQDWLACFGIFHSHPFTTNTNVTLSKAFKTNTDWWPTLPKTKLPWSDSDWSAFPGLVLVCANSPCRLGATRMGEAWKKQKNNSRKSYCYFSTHQKTNLNMFTLVTLVTRVTLACQGAFLEKQS